MKGYKCDRCGQWHGGRAGGYLCKYPTEPDDDEFDSKIYDLCPECYRSVFSYLENSAIGSD